MNTEIQEIAATCFSNRHGTANKKANINESGKRYPVKKQTLLKDPGRIILVGLIRGPQYLL